MIIDNRREYYERRFQYFGGEINSIELAIYNSRKLTDSVRKAVITLNQVASNCQGLNMDNKKIQELFKAETGWNVKSEYDGNYSVLYTEWLEEQLVDLYNNKGINYIKE